MVSERFSSYLGRVYFVDYCLVGLLWYKYGLISEPIIVSILNSTSSKSIFFQIVLQDSRTWSLTHFESLNGLINHCLDKWGSIMVMDMDDLITGTRRLPWVSPRTHIPYMDGQDFLLIWLQICCIWWEEMKCCVHFDASYRFNPNYRSSISWWK